MDKVHNLTEALGIIAGDVVTLTGAGGKTSCLYQLAEENKDRPVLLTTTTKMRLPSADQVEYRYCVDEIASEANPYQSGRTFLHGRLTAAGKCTSVTDDQISEIVSGFVLTVIEADGSKTLPLKGYFESEPCIPPFASVNVGILTVKGLDLEADPSFILRFDEFLQMAQIAPHQRITENHLARWIAHPQGMFKGGRGRKILFWNQVESQDQWRQVERVMKVMEQKFRAELARVVIGSVKNQEYHVL